MGSNNTIRDYKHDISGKFKDISTAIASMDESVFDDIENNEIFHAVHEVLLRMVKTSRNTIIDNLKQDIVLIVSDQAPDLNISKLQIEGVTVRYEIKNEKVEYLYSLQENTNDLVFSLGRILATLPIKKITLDTSDLNLKAKVESLGLFKP